MAKRFRVVTWPIRIIYAAVGITVGVVATGGLVGWTVTDSRMVIVALRESIPFWALIAGLIAVVATSANSPQNVVTKTTSHKGFRRILLAQLVPAAVACVGGVAIGSLPAIWTACQHIFPLNHWLVLITVLLGMVSVLAWAGLIATMIGHAIRWIVVPVATLMVVGLPEIVNTSILARINDSLGKDMSLLSVSHFWDIRFPWAGLDFQLPLEIFRAIFFTASMCVTIWVASFWRHASSIIGYLRSGAVFLILLALAGIATAFSPDLVHPSTEQQKCSPVSKDISVCLYPVHESIRNSTIEVASSTLAELPPLDSQWIVAESEYGSSEYSEKITLPMPMRDEVKWRSRAEEQIVSQVVPLQSCPQPDGNSMSDQWIAQQVLASVVAQRFLGRSTVVPEEYDKAAQYMANMSTQEFADWWSSHTAEISSCVLTSADFR